MSRTVIVTEPEFHKGKGAFAGWKKKGFRFVSVPSGEKFLSDAVLKYNSNAVIVGTSSYSKTLYEVLPEKGIIARFGVGHDGIDKNKATEKGIFVTNTPGVLDDSVAEHAVWLMGALARRIVELNSLTKSGNWAPETGIELRNKVLAIVGFGKIGKRICRIASTGFDMKIMAFDKFKFDGKQAQKEFGAEYTRDLKAALREADFISINLSPTPETRHFVNRNFLSGVKKGAILVNTSRGQIVDESALFDALREGRLSGAGLDVFENEPYRPVDKKKDLRKLPNVILTPHVSSNTADANKRMADAAMRNVECALTGKYDKLNLVNQEAAL